MSFLESVLEYYFDSWNDLFFYEIKFLIFIIVVICKVYMINENVSD